MLQTGVSSDGTTENSRTLPRELPRVICTSPAPSALNSGAWSPGLRAGPMSVTPFPLNLTRPVRSWAMVLLQTLPEFTFDLTRGPPGPAGPGRRGILPPPPGGYNNLSCPGGCGLIIDAEPYHRL